MPEVAVISTGDEILNGSIQDSNASFICARFFATNFSVRNIYCVRDDGRDLKKIIAYALENAGVCIITGGLGPTDDDVTVDTVCDLFGLGKIIHEPSREKMESFFRAYGRPMDKSDLKMVEVPENSVIIENTRGLAPGFAVVHAEKCVVCLPGVPSEMREMFDLSVLPFLKKRFGIEERESVTLRIAAMKESEINTRVLTMPVSFDDFHWGITAASGIATLTFVQKNRWKFDRERIFSEAERLFAENLIDKNFDSPEKELIYLLKKSSITLAGAESCTGGLASKRITDVSGASEVFLGSVVAYSDIAKTVFLGVDEASLKKFGAVSEEVAREMAAGAKKKFGADMSFSITGIAGPSGGSEQKPVGTLCFGFVCGKETQSFTRTIPGARERVRSFSALYAIEHLRRFLKKI